MIARRARAAMTLAVLVSTTAPLAAVAEPVDPGRQTTTQAEVDAAKKAVLDGQAEVKAAQAELDAARAKVEALYETAAVASEKANAARAELEKATQQAAEARAAADTAAAKAAASQASLEQMATQLYMRGGGGPLVDLAWLFTGATGDMARNEADLDAAKGYRTDHLQEARRTEDAAAQARAKAATAQKAQAAAAKAAASSLADAQKAVSSAEKQAAVLEAEEKKLVARLAQLRKTSVEVEQARQEQLQREAAEREAVRVRAEAARIAADATARAAATASTGSATDVAPRDLPAPDSEAAATAIAWAQKQLGKPYLWGGNGPAAFDCSGLMVGAWRAAGSSLPRTAQWQYGATARVAIADLQPGDLVFFGRSTSSIYHVGMYVGDGQMIEAPRTGLNLRYSSIYRSSLLPYGGRV